MILPLDLKSAELYSYASLEQALSTEKQGYWEINFNIPGIKSMPIAIRLFLWLQRHDKLNLQGALLFPDAGSSALAQREAPELYDEIFNFKDYLQFQTNKPNNKNILIAVTPEQADYDLFEKICNKHKGIVILLNGKLEDLAVGIGSVARERRRGFLSIWQPLYILKASKGTALQRRFPNDWEIYKKDIAGYCFLISIRQKPDAEILAKAVSTDQSTSLDMKFQSLDRYIQNLGS